MSRSLALIVFVVVGAACLATVKAAKWYDKLCVNDELTPIDMYIILKNQESNPEAREYAKLWETKICTLTSCTNRYNLPIVPKPDHPASLKRYIEYCEKYRKITCEKLAGNAEIILWATSDTSVVRNSLNILANIGDERAEKILYMEELGKDCDKLDELQVLAFFPFHGKDESLSVAEFQEQNLKRFRSDCAALRESIEEFKRKLVILNNKLTPESLKKLQNLREKAYASYLKGVDQKDIGELIKRAYNRRCSSKSLLMRFLKNQAPSSCEDVKLILIGTHADGKYLEALQSAPGRMRLNEGELEWIQTLFLCVEYTRNDG